MSINPDAHDTRLHITGTFIILLFFQYLNERQLQVCGTDLFSKLQSYRGSKENDNRICGPMCTREYCLASANGNPAENRTPIGNERSTSHFVVQVIILVLHFQLMEFQNVIRNCYCNCSVRLRRMINQ